MPRPHTPIPWILVDEGGVITITTDQRLADSLVEVAIVDADFYLPDEAFVDEQRANAELIVHAVNSHAALLSALLAQEEFEKQEEAYTELCDRAACEGWDDDPTGSSHLSSAMTRLMAAKDHAAALRTAALALARTA